MKPSQLRRDMSCASPWLRFLTACTLPSEPVEPIPFNSVSTTAELMRGLVGPLADVIFESAVYVNGVPEGAPETDEEWQHVVDSALGLAETGNLLMLDAHAQGRQDWIRFSNDLIDAAVLASNAALTRDFNAILDAGGVVWEACLACHEQYIPDE